MCGINGIHVYHYAAPALDRDELLRTREYMQTRGPDGAGAWFSEDGRNGLGHRRLAIIDLAARADQPMQSACGRYVIVFNGEIYNYRALRAQCEARGSVLRTQSDTEVVLALYALDGVAALPQLRGMYALAIHDQQSGKLLLARDPHGIKPLYLADDGWSLRFASSAQALLAGGRVSRATEPAAQVGFLLLGSVPEPWSWWSAIRMLPAGHWVEVGPLGPSLPRDHAQLIHSFQPAPQLAADELAHTLRAAVADSVRAHQVADVTVGVFLSAGIDSGAILGMAAHGDSRAVQAVTLGFPEFDGRRDDELPLAAEVASHYGAQQHVERVDAQQFAQDWPHILSAMDQPSIDGLNTWLVSRAARRANLKVVLSGLGGDELLAGYATFSNVPAWRRRLRLPAALPGAGWLWQHLLTPLARLAGLHPKSAGLLSLGRTLAGCYLLQRGLFLPQELSDLLPVERVREGLRRLALLPTLDAELQSLGSAVPANSAVGWLETRLYLRNQLLRDADWAGMAHGVEIRTPLVDHTLTRTLAPHLAQFSGGRGKQWLAQAASPALPAAVAGRAKSGFQTPIASWQQQLPQLQSWRRHPRLSAAHTPWARRYAASLLEHFGT